MKQIFSVLYDVVSCNFINSNIHENEKDLERYYKAMFESHPKCIDIVSDLSVFSYSIEKDFSMSVLKVYDSDSIFRDILKVENKENDK